jgi:putative peptidoglycan lipid II flippase
MSQMIKSTGAMGVATLSSRILGMVREIVYANFMGDSVVASAFKMALMIPNLFRRLLGEGALTASFIPIFKEKERNEGEAEMWKAANAVLSALIVFSVIFVALVMAGISVYLWRTAPTITGQGITASMEATRLMLELTRIMFPYMLLACLAAVLMGMLNARGHFFVPALGATILNICLITSVLVAAPLVGESLEKQIFVLAWGALIAGAAQAVYQLPTLFREGYAIRWVNPFGNPVVQRVMRQMVPGMFGVAAFQFNVLTTTGLAWYVDPTIIASYDYAVRLMEFPQGIFGVSIATFLLPALAGLAAEKKLPEFRATYRQAIEFLIFGNLVASILLVVLAKPMVRLLFQHGNFDALSTERAAFALACLGPGLVAFSMVHITARAFYALGDTQTPARISTFCLALNVVFGLLLIPIMRQGGMGAANTLSAAVNVGLLVFGLRKKLGRLDLAGFKTFMIQVSGASILAGLAAYATSVFWESRLGSATLWLRFGAVFGPIAAAVIVYFAAALWLRLPQAHELAQMVRAKVLRR